MKNEIISELLEYAKPNTPNANIQEIEVGDLVFEERVKLSCFYCNKYSASWRCPPRIPALDYQKIIREFEHAAFVWVELPLTKDDYNEVRVESSLQLHHVILRMEELLMRKGNPQRLSFIGGSCKLCKNGCGKEKCNNPYLARIPLEATGVNVIASAEKYGIKIKFPVEDHMIRIGLLLW